MVNGGQQIKKDFEEENAFGLQDQQLELLNVRLKERGIKFRVERVRQALFVRGTFLFSDATRKRTRIRLGLKALVVENEFSVVENRAIQLESKIKKLGHVPDEEEWWIAPFEVKKRNTKKTVQEAVVELEQDFWDGRTKTSAAERTWDRMNDHYKKLPPGAVLTTDLLLGHIETTEEGSNARVKSCQYLKRLGKFHDLRELSKIDSLVGEYEPKAPTIPDEEHLQELVEILRNEKKWGWCSAALYLYGCRPSEVFSLQVKEDGIAKVLTLKRKKKNPKWRTTLALPQHLVNRLDMQDVSKPYEVNKVEEYDSKHAAYLVNAWGKWFRKRRGHLDCSLYDIRHSWAIRSLKRNMETGLAATCMGHDISTHVSTYLGGLQEKDVIEAAKNLS